MANPGGSKIVVGEQNKYKPAYGQEGLEWAPKNSEFRRMEQGDSKYDSSMRGRQYPTRMATAFKEPFNFMACYGCYAEALWHCAWCHMDFCHQEPCKEGHEAAHTIMLLAGNDE